MTRKNGQPPRHSKDLEAELAIVAELYLKGTPVKDIANAIGVTGARGSQLVTQIRERWCELYLQNFDQIYAEQLAKIDRLEAEYWAAWQRSLEIRIKTVEVNATGGPGGGRSEDRTEKEDPRGVPAYLDGVMKCIEKRCQLLGLEPPRKLEVQTDGPAPQLTVILANGKEVAPRELNW